MFAKFPFVEQWGGRAFRAAVNGGTYLEIKARRVQKLLFLYILIWYNILIKYSYLYMDMSEREKHEYIYKSIWNEK